MGALLQDNLPAEIEYVAGSGGVFEVTVDGREIFSKAKNKTFPNPEELLATIKKITAQP